MPRPQTTSSRGEASWIEEWERLGEKEAERETEHRLLDQEK